MKREVLKRYLIITFFFFLMIIGYYCYQESKCILKDNYITVNKDSGFYDKTIKIKLHKNIDLPIGTKLYYTLDGNDPTKESEQYKKSIKLKLDENETKVYPLKIIAYYKGQYSNIIEKTYVIDKNIKDNDINIISITSNEENLYDYEKGILVDGKTYDEYIEKNGPIECKIGNYSNKGDEWIKKSEFFMFDKDGNVILTNDVGLTISGSCSRGAKVKSFNVNFRDYSERVNYNFYEDNLSSNYSFVNNYNTLLLRAGGNDLFRTNLKSSLVNRLCEYSNFDGCSTSERTLVFINGTFYGVFDINQTFSNSTLAKKYYFSDSSNIFKLKSNEYIASTRLHLFDYLDLDLSEEENRKLLEEKIDMNNYLLYYALEILIKNTDWPGNNYGLWKYTGEYDEINPYTDGKYRFLLYDSDFAYSKLKVWTGEDNFKHLMEHQYRGNATRFTNVVASKYYRDKYIMLTQDLLNTSFKEENILKIADEEYNKIYNSYKKYYDELNYNNFKDEYQGMVEKIKIRDDELLEDFNKYFELEETHRVNIKANEGIQVNFSNQELYQNKKYTNNYYKDIDLRYTYKEYPGYKFSYWLVNGEKIYDEELVVESEKYKDIEEINIEAVAEYIKEENHLLISEIYAKGDSDWIKITNTGKENIDISNYYLSNNETALMKYSLPNKVLKPNESIIINGDKNYYSMGEYICNFNIKEGEKIVLSRDNIIIDSLNIPRMSEIETYGRYDNSSTFKFFMNENNERKNID